MPRVSTPTKLSIASTSASSLLSAPSTAIVLSPIPPQSCPASSITSWEPRKKKLGFTGYGYFLKQVSIVVYWNRTNWNNIQTINNI